MKGIFFIPIENPNLKYSFILEKIKNEVVFSESIGLDEAFFGEHLTDRYERLSSSLMMIAALSKLTNRIRLGTMTTNLTFYNPALMSCLISTVDNLTSGRLILGIGSGSNPTDIEFAGNKDKDNFLLLKESLTTLVELLNAKGIIDFKSKTFSISTKFNANNELQLGYLEGLFDKRNDLEIVMPALGINSKNVQYCAENNLSILSSNFCSETILKNHIDHYSREAKLSPSEISKKVRICRFIFVCEKESDIKKYLYCENSPYLKMIDIIYKKLRVFKKHYIFGENVNNSLDAAKKIIMSGTPEMVNSKISDLKNRLGCFKTLIYASTPYSENKIYKNSLKLFGENVIF